MNYSGEFRSRIEFFIEEKTKQPTGERLTALESLGKRWAKREDVQSTEDEKGKLIALDVCKFIVRFNWDIMNRGTKMIIDDFDGQHRVTGVRMVDGYKTFLELKCIKREP